VRRLWWWLRGYSVCYAEHESGNAFCKRRKHHLGRHATGNRTLRWLVQEDAGEETTVPKVQAA